VALSSIQKKALLAQRDALNPRQLREAIYSLLDRLFALPCAAPDGLSQDVYLTLFNSPDLMKGDDCPSVTLSFDLTRHCLLFAALLFASSFSAASAIQGTLISGVCPLRA